MGVCLFYYLTAINITAFIVYGIDKLKAKKGKWRIPESTLLLLAVVGGSIGAWCGVKVWHHKTMHKKFKALYIILCKCRIRDSEMSLVFSLLLIL